MRHYHESNSKGPSKNTSIILEQSTNRVVDWPQKAILDTLLEDLEEEIVVEVCILGPKSLRETMR
jgi:hypothetical protein